MNTNLVSLARHVIPVRSLRLLLVAVCLGVSGASVRAANNTNGVPVLPVWYEYAMQAYGFYQSGMASAGDGDTTQALHDLDIASRCAGLAIRNGGGNYACNLARAIGQAIQRVQLQAKRPASSGDDANSDDSLDKASRHNSIHPKTNVQHNNVKVARPVRTVN